MLKPSWVAASWRASSNPAADDEGCCCSTSPMLPALIAWPIPPPPLPAPPTKQAAVEQQQAVRTSLSTLLSAWWHAAAPPQLPPQVGGIDALLEALEAGAVSVQELLVATTPLPAPASVQYERQQHEQPAFMQADGQLLAAAAVTAIEQQPRAEHSRPAQGAGVLAPGLQKAAGKRWQRQHPVAATPPVAAEGATAAAGAAPSWQALVQLPAGGAGGVRVCRLPPRKRMLTSDEQLETPGQQHVPHRAADSSAAPVHGNGLLEGQAPLPAAAPASAPSAAMLVPLQVAAPQRQLFSPFAAAAGPATSPALGGGEDALAGGSGGSSSVAFADLPGLSTLTCAAPMHVSHARSAAAAAAPASELGPTTPRLQPPLLGGAASAVRTAAVLCEACGSTRAASNVIASTTGVTTAGSAPVSGLPAAAPVLAAPASAAAASILAGGAAPYKQGLHPAATGPGAVTLLPTCISMPPGHWCIAAGTQLPVPAPAWLRQQQQAAAAATSADAAPAPPAEGIRLFVRPALAAATAAMHGGCSGGGEGLCGHSPTPSPRPSPTPSPKPSLAITLTEARTSSLGRLDLSMLLPTSPSFNTASLLLPPASLLLPPASRMGSFDAAAAMQVLCTASGGAEAAAGGGDRGSGGSGGSGGRGSAPGGDGGRSRGVEGGSAGCCGDGGGDCGCGGGSGGGSGGGGGPASSSWTRSASGDLFVEAEALLPILPLSMELQVQESRVL